LEDLETQKTKLNELLEKTGLEGKKNEVKSQSVEVESLNKKEKPLEIEDQRDSFFVKGEENEQDQIQKKKKVKQQQGPKSVPVSEVFHVRQKRHRGFNTVPEEKKNFSSPKEPKTENPKEVSEGTKTENETKNETKDNKSQQPDWGTDSKSSPKWDSDSKSSPKWDNKSQQNWGSDRSQGNPRKQPRGNNQSKRNNRFVDFESTQQFPPLSGEFVPKEAPNKWGPQDKQ